MMSVLSLEQPSRWRGVGVAGVLALAVSPVIALLYRALQLDAPPLGGAFWASIQRSVAIACAAALAGSAAGLPLGVLGALYDFKGRRMLFTITALPLLAPPFLWAIGWSELATRISLLRDMLGGASGSTVVFAATIAPLVLCVSYAATRELSRSQVEAARLANGEGRVLRLAARHAFAPAFLAAALGGVLTVADPGVGQIVGVHTAADEILASFAAQYDVALAAKQCLALTVLVLLVSAPLAIVVGPRLAHAVLARQLTRGETRRGKGACSLTAGFSVVALVTVGLPIGGLLLPLLSAGPWPSESIGESWQQNHFLLVGVGALATAAGTATNTLLYAGGAAVVATTLGFGLASLVGRSGRLRSVVLAGCFVLFAWPSAASALGVAAAAAESPQWLDPIVRSRLTVCGVLGLRLFPISAFLALRGWGAMSPSWAHAGALHRVRFWTYLRRVVWPELRPSVGSSLVLTGLLASADVGTVLLLHPPGERSLPLAILTVMANAPESTVATLCLVYLLVALGLLSVARRLGTRGREG